MRIINTIYGIYGIAIAAAHAVGTNSGSGQHNNGKDTKASDRISCRRKLFDNTQNKQHTHTHTHRT